MKNAVWVLADATLEVPWFAVIVIALAALAFLWLILRKGFSLYIKGRDNEISVITTKERADRPPTGKPPVVSSARAARTPHSPPHRPPHPPEDSSRAA